MQEVTSRNAKEEEELIAKLGHLPKTKSSLKADIGWGFDRVNRVLPRLVARGIAKIVTVDVETGNGAKRNAEAIVLVEHHPAGSSL